MLTRSTASVPKPVGVLAALAVGLTSPLFSQVSDLTKAGVIAAIPLCCLPAVQAADASR